MLRAPNLSEWTFVPDNFRRLLIGGALLQPGARSPTSSSRSPVILRAAAIVHFGFKAQVEQAFLAAL